MIIIKSLDKFKDGGSIGIDMIYIKNPNDTVDLESNSPLIVIDYAIGSETQGQWYNGFKDKGGKLIEDVNFKKNVINAIEEHIRFENIHLEQIKKSI